MTTVDADGALERLLLREELTEFLYREADLLDERRYEEWLDLLTEDCRYEVPLRMNVAYADVEASAETRPGRDICWFDESKETLASRVAQLATGVHWAEEPVSRVSHIVSNVRIVDVSEHEVAVTCRFVVYRNRVADETDFLVGRRRDVLRRTGDGWRLAHRRMLLDQSVLLAKNLSVFL